MALGLPAGVTAVLVGWLLGGHPGVVLMLTTVAAVGARTAPRAALAAGAVCWACYDGFVLHGLGVLDAGTADLVSLTVSSGVRRSPPQHAG